MNKNPLFDGESIPVVLACTSSRLTFFVLILLLIFTIISFIRWKKRSGSDDKNIKAIENIDSK